MGRVKSLVIKEATVNFPSISLLSVIVNYYLTGSEKVKLIVFEKFDDQWTPIVDLIKCGFRLYGLDCIIERLRTYLLPYR